MKKNTLLLLVAAALSLSPVLSVWCDDEHSSEVLDGSTNAVGENNGMFNFDNDEFQNMLKQLEEQMKKAKESLPEEKRIELEGLEHEVKDLGIKLDNLHTELLDFQDTKATYKSVVKVLRESIAALEKDKLELMQSIGKIAEEIQKSSGDEAAALETELTTKNAELEKINAEITLKTAELEEKRRTKKETKSKIAAHEQEITATEEEMNKKNEAMQSASPWGGQDFDFESLFSDLPTDEASSSSEGVSGKDESVESVAVSDSVADIKNGETAQEKGVVQEGQVALTAVDAENLTTSLDSSAEAAA